MANSSTKVVHSGRTTVVKDGITVVRKGTIDIDAILEEKGFGAPALEDIKTKPIHLFGEDFRVMETTNVFNIMMFGSDDIDDTARSVKSIIEMIHPDDQSRFKSGLAKRASLSGEALGTIINEMLQAATGANPTSSSSGSGRTARRTTSRALSPAN